MPGRKAPGGHDPGAQVRLPGRQRGAASAAWKGHRAGGDQDRPQAPGRQSDSHGRSSRTYNDRNNVLFPPPLQLDAELKKSVDVCELLDMAETLKEFLVVAGGRGEEELLLKMKKLRLRPTYGKKTLAKVGRALFMVLIPVPALFLSLYPSRCNCATLRT